MRISALILTAVVVAHSIAPAAAQDESTKKVNELQKEWIATLKEMAANLEVLFRNGRVEIDELLEAQLLLKEAELEVAEKESDRIAIYKNLVNILKQYEALADERVKSARGTRAAVLKIRARRLEAEIHLAQAKLKNPDLAQHKIVVTSPKAKDVVITQQYACQIHSWHHIKVRSLQSGYLEEIPVKEGQAVKQGEVLFKVTPILYKAKLDAELSEAKLAELDLKNAERLFTDKVVNQDEVARFQAKLAMARAKAKRAEAELNFTMVRAPFDGIIDRLHEQQGSLVTERDVLTTLSDNSIMWVYFNVPQARYLEYVTGPDKDGEAKIELLLSNGKTFPHLGKIGAIDAQFNHETGNIPFRADFPNPDRLLRHGMTGAVLVHRTLNNVIVIPQPATFEILDKRYVYVVDKDDVVHQREIVVQHELADLFVINSGVGVNDRMIIEGGRHVRDGEKVEYEFRSPD